MDAGKQLILATYKYNGIDSMMDTLNKRYVPIAVRKGAEPVIFVVNLVTKKQITLTWRFP